MLTTEDRIAKESMSALWADAELGNKMDYLAARWADEREYENIEDYAIPLTPIVERHGGKIVAMHSRPFGCRILFGERLYDVSLYANGRFVCRYLDKVPAWPPVRKSANAE